MSNEGEIDRRVGPDYDLFHATVIDAIRYGTSNLPAAANDSAAPTPPGSTVFGRGPIDERRIRRGRVPDRVLRRL